VDPLDLPPRAPTDRDSGLQAQWAAEALRRELEGLCPGGVLLEVVEEIGSTNAALLAALREQTADAAPTARVLVAQRQTAGRGRLGRIWHAQPGASLTFSVAWPLRRADASGLSLAAGVALAQALDPQVRAGAGPFTLALKWPNDLWLRDPRVDSGGRKLGGILIETTGGPTWRWCVIGVGLNILPQTAGDFATGQAWLREIDPGATPASTLARITPALLEALKRFERLGFDAFLEGFRERDVLRGREVATTVPTLAAGRADGIDTSGRLLVQDALGVLHAVNAGDVSVRPARTTAPEVPAHGREASAC
jgi:BirA family biotin operon repressor/biotin-[acetyl-CoA-carboxylase] ligase